MIVGPLTVERRWDDWHACITGQPGVWGCGPSVAAAFAAVEPAHQAAGGRARGFTVEHADALRRVGAEATVVGRGSYGRDGEVPCPVTLACPGAVRDTPCWVSDFAHAFDDASWDSIADKVEKWDDGWVLHITENNIDSTEGGA